MTKIRKKDKLMRKMSSSSKHKRKKKKKKLFLFVCFLTFDRMQSSASTEGVSRPKCEGRASRTSFAAEKSKHENKMPRRLSCATRALLSSFPGSVGGPKMKAKTSAAFAKRLMRASIFCLDFDTNVEM